MRSRLTKHLNLGLSSASLPLADDNIPRETSDEICTIFNRKWYDVMEWNVGIGKEASSKPE